MTPNEETRLREGLAEARMNLKLEISRHERSVGFLVEESVRATAAESALAEARGALREIAADGMPWSQSIARAALARAGEQETPASDTRRVIENTRNLLKDEAAAIRATPPPGEQGKGGGEGLAAGPPYPTISPERVRGRLVSADLEEGTLTIEAPFDHVTGGEVWVTAIPHSALAPAQPAEHPAPGYRKCACPISATPDTCPWRGVVTGTPCECSCHNPHPASGGEE